MDSLSTQFPPDATELRVRDIALAGALVRERRSDLFAIMSDVGGSFLKTFGKAYEGPLKRTQDALALSFVRMASRHGSWGQDFHHYHNEEHSLELLNGRLARVRLQLGWKALEPEEWLLLALFATCHDLRQREFPHFEGSVGSNERASIAETQRILALAQFDPERDAEFYQTLQAMIAGSTFDARPDEHGLNSADAVSSGGSLAPRLTRELQIAQPLWNQDPVLRRRARVMLLSADLDTANVGEPFMALAGSAVRLVQEREMRAGRPLDAHVSAEPVFEFLTEGQERYFFRLHRFVSELGREVFGLGKTINSPKVKLQADLLRQRFGPNLQPQVTGQALIDAFLETASSLA